MTDRSTIDINRLTLSQAAAVVGFIFALIVVVLASDVVIERFQPPDMVVMFLRVLPLFAFLGGVTYLRRWSGEANPPTWTSLGAFVLVAVGFYWVTQSLHLEWDWPMIVVLVALGIVAVRLSTRRSS